MALVVVTSFADYAVGETISDAAAIEAVLASDAARFVVRVADDEPKAPAAKAAPAPEPEEGRVGG